MCACEKSGPGPAHRSARTESLHSRIRPSCTPTRVPRHPDVGYADNAVKQAQFAFGALISHRWGPAPVRHPALFLHTTSYAARFAAANASNSSPTIKRPTFGLPSITVAKNKIRCQTGLVCWLRPASFVRNVSNSRTPNHFAGNAIAMDYGYWIKKRSLPSPGR